MTASAALPAGPPPRLVSYRAAARLTLAQAQGGASIATVGSGTFVGLSRCLLGGPGSAVAAATALVARGAREALVLTFPSEALRACGAASLGRTLRRRADGPRLPRADADGDDALVERVQGAADVQVSTGGTENACTPGHAPCPDGRIAGSA